MLSAGRRTVKKRLVLPVCGENSGDENKKARPTQYGLSIILI
jgi:hypothetical protein